MKKKYTTKEITTVKEVWKCDLKDGAYIILLLRIHVRSAHRKILGFPMGDG